MAGHAELMLAGHGLAKFESSSLENSISLSHMRTLQMVVLRIAKAGGLVNGPAAQHHFSHRPASNHL